MVRSTSLGLFFFFLARMANATCYGAKGDALDSSHDDYIPCPASGLSTICCGLNRPNPSGGDESNGFTKDECLPNGLCQNRIVKNGTMNTSYWLDFCTDRNIASGNCLNICASFRDDFGNTQLTPCTAGRNDSAKWCCGSSNDCCTSGVSVITLPQIFRASGISSSPSVSTTASSLASVSSSSSTSSLSSSPSSSSGANDNSGISGGAIAGIVVGIMAIVALIAIAIFFALRASKYKKQAAANNADGGPAYVEAPGDIYHGGNAILEKYGHEYQHNGGPAELPQPPSELAGEDYSPLPKR